MKLTNLNDKKLILGSASPRRMQLLSALDLTFEQRVLPVEEKYPSFLAPEDVPLFLAEKKAHEHLKKLKEHEIILTADTIVLKEQEILEKPKDKADAFRMIKQLSGSSHTVVTGVCIENHFRKESFSDSTRVEFMSLDDEEIEYYIDKYAPFDKAGSYGAQDWIGHMGIKKLTGSYFNVMGLPVHLVYQKLKLF